MHTYKNIKLDCSYRTNFTLVAISLKMGMKEDNIFISSPFGCHL